MIFLEEQEAVLGSCITEGINCISYGRSGFGKSKLIELVTSELGKDLNVIHGHDSMTSEALIGIPDMKRLMDDSEYVTKFESTFFAKPGVVVIEEGLKIPSEVLSCLTDMITRGGLWCGDTFVPMLCDCIIITGNSNPDDCIIDESDVAFFKQRFPVWLSFDWPINTKNVTKYIKTKYTDYYLNNTNRCEVIIKHACQCSLAPRLIDLFMDILIKEVMPLLNHFGLVDIEFNNHDVKSIKKKSEEIYNGDGTLSHKLTKLLGMRLVVDLSNIDDKELSRLVENFIRSIKDEIQSRE